MNVESDYLVTIKGDGLSIERQVNQATAFQLVAIALEVSSSPPAKPPPPDESDASHTQTDKAGNGSPPAQSIGEFIDESHATRNPDKITAMGVFLTNSGKSEFTTDEIKPLFQQAGEPFPSNFPRDWKWAVTAKWIAPTSEGNTFYVTNKGLEAVNEKFSKEVRDATRQPTSKRSRKKGADDR